MRPIGAVTVPGPRLVLVPPSPLPADVPRSSWLPHQQVSRLASECAAEFVQDSLLRDPNTSFGQSPERRVRDARYLAQLVKRQLPAVGDLFEPAHDHGQRIVHHDAVCKAVLYKMYLHKYAIRGILGPLGDKSDQAGHTQWATAKECEKNRLHVRRAVLRVYRGVAPLPAASTVVRTLWRVYRRTPARVSGLTGAYREYGGR